MRVYYDIVIQPVGTLACSVVFVCVYIKGTVSQNRERLNLEMEGKQIGA